MKNQVFINTLSMETQTVYAENGNINIYPCSFEQGHNLVKGGTRVSQKGRMVTEDDGTSRFRPYASDSFQRYKVLYRTAHGAVKETQGSIICELRFPKRLGKQHIGSLFRLEANEQAAFIKTRQTQTEW